MLRISKLTDYATVVLATLAEQPDQLRTAAALAGHTRIAAPTVSKLLKQLHKAGLLSSTRGLRGGYQLAHPPAQITLAAVVDALEGPVALTDCATGASQCDIAHHCRSSQVWQRLNLAMRRALSEVTLAELTRPPQGQTPPPFAPLPWPSLGQEARNL